MGYKTLTDRTYGKGNRVYVQRAVATVIPTLPTATNVAASTFFRIAGIVSIDGIATSREEVDVTELDNIPDTLPTGGQEEQYYYKKKFPGDKSIDDLSLELNLNEPLYVVLLDMYGRDEQFTIQLRLRSGATGTFVGYIKEIKNKFESNKLVTCSVVFTPVEGLTWVGASS